MTRSHSKRPLAILGVSLVAASALVGGGIASAHGPMGPTNVEARAAVEAGDYTAWSEAMADHPQADSFVTEATFNVLVEAEALRASGDREAARELLRESDIFPPRGERMERGEGEHENTEEHEERHERMEAAREAVAAGDLNTWLTLTADHPEAETFSTEATFNVLVEAEALREADDHEGAHLLLEENGIFPPRGVGRHR